MYRAVALWALRLGVATSDMHRLEQLAKEAKIELLAGDDHRVLLNGEDVTEDSRIAGFASGFEDFGRARRAARAFASAA